MELSANSNENYNILNDNISALHKKVKFQKHKHKKKNSWVTNGIVRSIKFRDRLYADLQMTAAEHTSYLIKKFNLTYYNRIRKQNIRIAQKMYCYSCFETFQDDF